ncbi:MAG: ferrochelatase [Geobacteraceae bacterium]|nr:ferrochelatase [Geobacteraceae bacterium]
MPEKTAVLLLQMGGPDSLDAVEPFLRNLFSDREIIRLGPLFLQPALARWIARRRAPKAEDSYERIGGRSPIRELTEAQARALEARLGDGFRCFTAMRYWRPSTIEALAAVRRAGISRIVAQPLYPQYSRATTGSSFKELQRILSLAGVEFRVSCIEGFHDHPLFIEALAGTIAEGLGGFSSGEAPTLLFSAHSLPVSFIERGDPYLSQVKETVRLVMERFPDRKHELAFQSKAGPVKWLEPSTEETISRLAENGCRNILVVPISFVSDHIETLYEIDIAYAALARDRGISTFRRAPALNTNPLFIECLAELVMRAV